jgi:hypothetical protein
MSLKRTIYLLVTIDTECDKNADWTVKQPLQFEAVTTGIRDILSPLFKKYGIKPTYLLSPEVIANDTAAGYLSTLSPTECELGTHLHAEFIPPDADFTTRTTNLTQASMPPSIEFEKLKNLTKLFESRFDYAPKSFRAGRFSLSRHTLGHLQQLGYAVDSSVTPYLCHHYDAAHACNYWGAPLTPYHPSTSDFRKSGDMPLLEVPVSHVVPAFTRLPAAGLRSWGKYLFEHRRLCQLFGLSRERYWIRPCRGTAAQLCGWTDWIIEQWPNQLPVINVMFHNVEVIPGASPYTDSPQAVDTFVADLDALFAHLDKRYSVSSMGLSELPALIP